MISQRSKPQIYSKVISRRSSDKADYICDGTDDNVQIQAAIDAVEAAGGGTVFLRAGTYVIGASLTIQTDGVCLVGEGMGSTIIQAKTAFPTTHAIIECDAQKIDLKNFTIDGNKANQTTENHYGIHIDWDSSGDDHYCTINRVEVKNINRDSAGGTGIYLANGKSTLIDNVYVHDCDYRGFDSQYSGDESYITNSLFESNGGIGLSLTDGSATVVNCVSQSNTGSGFSAARSECLFIGCKSNSNGISGFSISTARASIIGCSSYLNTSYGIYSSSGGDIFSNNIIIENKKDGIYITGGDNNTISGNYIDPGDALDADNTYSGILLTGTTLRNIVTGNRILQSSGTNNYAYGIREAATADDYNNISGNNVTGAQTAQVSRQGVNSIAENNIDGSLHHLSKSITIESPGSAEDITMFFTNEAITIKEMRAVLIGSSTPSVTWTIRHHATDRSNAGNEVVTGGTTTTSTTSGSDVTSFNDATIPADSFVWLETTAQSGTVGELSVTIFYTKD